MANIVITNGNALVRSGKKKLINGSVIAKENFARYEKKAALVIARGIVNTYAFGLKTKNSLRILLKILLKIMNRAFIVYSESVCELIIALTISVKQNIKRLTRAIALVVMCIIFSIVFTTMLIYLLGINDKYTFSKNNWENNASDRTKMISNLEEQYEIVGMEENEIINILGNPYSVTLKENFEYKFLDNEDYDKVVEYRINKGSMSLFDILERHYAIAYKDGKAIWKDVIIADVTDN